MILQQRIENYPSVASESFAMRFPFLVIIMSSFAASMRYLPMVVLNSVAVMSIIDTWFPKHNQTQQN